MTQIQAISRGNKGHVEVHLATERERLDKIKSLPLVEVPKGTPNRKRLMARAASRRATRAAYKQRLIIAAELRLGVLAEEEEAAVPKTS